MKASDLFVKALENEGVKYIFGILGEENLDLLDSIRKSSKQLVLQNYCGNKKDTLIIMPPLIVKKEELEEILARINRGVLNLKKIKKKKVELE